MPYTYTTTYYPCNLHKVKTKGHIRRRGNCIRALTEDTLGRSCFISVSIVLTLLHSGADLGHHQLLLLRELLWMSEVTRQFRSGKPHGLSAQHWVAEMKTKKCTNSWSQFRKFRNIALGVESTFHHFMNNHTSWTWITTSVKRKNKR